MKPDREKELEELKNRQNNKDLFSGMYDDLFGSGKISRKGSGESGGKDSGKSSVKVGGKDSGAGAGKSSGKVSSDNPLISDEELAAFIDSRPITESGEDALKQAADALKEAREMLADLTLDLSRTTNIAGSVPSAVPNEQKTEEPSSASAGKPAEPEAAKPEEPEIDPMEELDGLIGLTTIKKDVRELADFVTIQKMRKDLGMKSVPVSLHLVFTGNPGTGKTTVARILAKIYKKIGVLSKGQLVEVDRSGLVAGYVGQTALKTQDRIKEALGGILFIDEAYALAQKDDAFGQEAIDTVLKAMEDHRDDFVVIVAGYTGPMEKFINSNPGLKSRFNKYIEFPDYTLDELEAIFNLSCKKYDYHPDEDAQRQIRELLKLRMMTRHENFANAREARNLFEEIVTNQARRIAAIENPTQEQITTILVEDLSEST